VGVHTSNAVFEDKVYRKRTKGVLLMVSYARDTATLMRVLIELAPGVLSDPVVDKLEIRQRRTDAEDAVVHIELRPDTIDSVIDLPIHADVLDPARAELPPGASAKIVPIE